MIAGHNGPMRRIRPVLAAACAVAALAGCGGDDDDASTRTLASTAPPATTAAPSTTAPPLPTNLVPGTDGGDPEYPEPTPPPTEPLITTPITVATTVAATAPPTATSGPPTSEPVAVAELVLSGDGIGSARFGTDPEAVIGYVGSILGGNTGDSGWVAPDTFGFCPGSEVRRVDWGSLSLLFSDASDITAGRRHFMAWEYGRLGELGDEPRGLRTAGGVTLGSRVVDVLGEFPEATVIEGDAEVDIPDQVYVDDSFVAWVSGVAEDDFVTVLFGGFRCGG